jgi:hypothetical protein
MIGRTYEWKATAGDPPRQRQVWPGGVWRVIARSKRTSALRPRVLLVCENCGELEPRIPDDPNSETGWCCSEPSSVFAAGVKSNGKGVTVQNVLVENVETLERAVRPWWPAPKRVEV